MPLCSTELQRSQRSSIARKTRRQVEDAHLDIDRFALDWPKILNAWNEKSDWLKLIAVSGKKNQLIVD